MRKGQVPEEDLWQEMLEWRRARSRQGRQQWKEAPLGGDGNGVAQGLQSRAGQHWD